MSRRARVSRIVQPSLFAIWFGKSSAIHDYSADKPQTKNEGEGRHNVIKIGKNKKRKKKYICGIEK